MNRAIERLSPIRVAVPRIPNAAAPIQLTSFSPMPASFGPIMMPPISNALTRSISGPVMTPLAMFCAWSTTRPAKTIVGTTITTSESSTTSPAAAEAGIRRTSQAWTGVKITVRTSPPIRPEA